MQIVKPYARLIQFQNPQLIDSQVDNPLREFTSSDGINLLRKIEWCGRISHRSEESMTVDSYDRFIRAVVLGHGDWSIVEHASATVDFLVDRGITHEIVRHRLASYTQESTRFCNYGKKDGQITVICPMKQLDTSTEEFESQNYVYWWNAINMCEKYYLLLLKNNVKPQIARSVLPNALASRLIATMNLRTWRHFFVMRVSAEAHPQMKEVTIPLLEEFQEKIPILYEDIEPEKRQAELMKLVR